MNVLWKFKSVRRLEWVEAFVLCDEIYFSHPSELNDPSETRLKFRYDYSARYEDLLEQFTKSHPGATEAEATDFVAGLMDGRTFENLERILRDELFDSFRVFCLSQTATNPVMWGHYADDHAGVCVGLDADRIVASCPVAVHGAVRYQDEPFSLKFDPHEDTAAMLRRLAPALFTKDRRWSYEQEQRFVTFMDPAVQAAPAAVRSVVLGFRATPETHRLVMQWKAQKPYCRFFRRALLGRRRMNLISYPSLH